MFNLEKAKELELQRIAEASKKYPDIKMLYEDYLSLIEQNKKADEKGIHNQRWSKEFLEGYYSCISDLIIIKKRK